MGWSDSYAREGSPRQRNVASKSRWILVLTAWTGGRLGFGYAFLSDYVNSFRHIVESRMYAAGASKAESDVCLLVTEGLVYWTAFRNGAWGDGNAM